MPGSGGPRQPDVANGARIVIIQGARSVEYAGSGTFDDRSGLCAATARCLAAGSDRDEGIMR